jgi:hypothetical protein
MSTDYPLAQLTPPPELVEKWYDAIDNSSTAWKQKLANAAAQWGADMELEACIKWIQGRDWTWTSAQLRATRRPKPPRLKEEALEALEQIDGYAIDQLSAYTIHKELKQYANTIRRALEALPND